jgi:hypothetical protein
LSDALEGTDHGCGAFEGQDVNRARATQQGFGSYEPLGGRIAVKQAEGTGENIMQVDDAAAHFSAHRLFAGGPAGDLGAIGVQQAGGGICAERIHQAKEKGTHIDQIIGGGAEDDPDRRGLPGPCSTRQAHNFTITQHKVLS